MTNLKDSEFRELTGYMKANYGINLTEKRLLIEGRLINKLTTNHTYFMREEEHFKYFRDNVLPYLEENSKTKDLRI